MKKSLLYIAGVATASLVALTAFYTEEKTDQQLIDAKVEEMVTKFKADADVACQAEARSEAASLAAPLVEEMKAAAAKTPGKKVKKPTPPPPPAVAPTPPPAAPPVDPQKGRGGTTPGGKVEDQKARGGTTPEGGKVQDQKARGGK
jgi:hypothetical protein